MMFKSLVTFIFIVFVVIIPGEAVYAENANVIKAKDILFVYDDDLTQRAQENVAAIADILTYMGYGTTYSTVAESRGRLGKFESILFYHEGNSVATSFQQELRGLNNKILVVGGGDTTDILKALGLNYKAFHISEAAVRFTYPFSEGKDSSGLINADRAVILQGEFPYRAGYIEAGGKASALCVRAGRFSAMGVFDCNSNILKAALTDQVSKWKWPYENLPHSYPQYIVYDNVFPFFSSERMLKVVEMMAEKGVPYSITVMPVYQNSEYPAMKHFCETLRYAQAKGASIILKAPIINTEKPSLVEINKRLTAAVAAYNRYGVYPIAIEAPNNWIHEKMGLDVLRRFSTVVLYPEAAKNNWSDTDGYNTVYSDGHHLIAPALSDGDIGKNLIISYSTALFLDMNAEIGTLENQIEQIQGSEVPLKSVWSIAHTVYTDDRVVKTEGNILTLNGKAQSMEYTPFVYEDNFNYNRGVIGRLAESMARENKRLLIIVTGISVLFIIFIAVARYQNRRRFLYKRKSEPKSNKEGVD